MPDGVATREAFSQCDLPLPGKMSGKVRDWYILGDGTRLMVTTDRLSAFDRVLAAVPYKGQVLNQLSAWWFAATRDIIDNHLISVPDPNALIAREVEPLPVEVIVRGYITGVTSTALWQRYSLGERSIYGYDFPEGLTKNQKLPEPIITPTTKGGATGHDERLTCAEVTEKGLLDPDSWEKVKKAALALFARGQEKAAASGLILVDTKYEFGRGRDGGILLIDEVLAVGDTAFRTKCFDHFHALKKAGTTIVFVTHDMSMVREFCDRVILIEGSRIVAEGAAEEIAGKYAELFSPAPA